jgi:protein-disulfide isomerase
VRADDMSAEMILNDPEAPVGGNPNGDLTIVSFFDYNCPFCKRTVEPLNTVLESDGNVRHVYKDWPILAQSSVYGAKLALAAGYQNRYEEAYLALMGIEGTRRVSRPKPTAATPRSPPCFSAITRRPRGSVCVARPCF